MQRMTTAAERRIERMAVASAILAAAAAIALPVVPNAVERLTGIPRAVRLQAPDDLPAPAKDDPMAFLIGRDQIEIRVAEATTLGELLDRNRLNKPSQRAQIVEQLGSNNPEAAIAAGTTFKIRLTPSARDVPGTK